MGFRQSWENTYRNDFQSGGGQLTSDLLRLDEWRADADAMRANERAAYDAQAAAWAQANPNGQMVRRVVDRGGELTEEEFTATEYAEVNPYADSAELADLQSRVSALDYYDAQMPEAGKTRQAQRDLDATKARITANRQADAARRDELRAGLIRAKDVKTSQRGV